MNDALYPSYLTTTFGNKSIIIGPSVVEYMLGVFGIHVPLMLPTQSICPDSWLLLNEYQAS